MYFPVPSTLFVNTYFASLKSSPLKLRSFPFLLFFIVIFISVTLPGNSNFPSLFPFFPFYTSQFSTLSSFCYLLSPSHFFSLSSRLSTSTAFPSPLLAFTFSPFSPYTNLSYPHSPLLTSSPLPLVHSLPRSPLPLFPPATHRNIYFSLLWKRVQPAT